VVAALIFLKEHPSRAIVVLLSKVSPRWHHVSLRAVLATMCMATGVGCEKNQYDLPPSLIEGDQAVALFRREAERRAITRPFLGSERVETQTPGGKEGWLVRLVADGDDADLCGYVWRDEEPGRAAGTVIRIRFDAGCRHWRAKE
jgi:hypothetical protein